MYLHILHKSLPARIFTTFSGHNQIMVTEIDEFFKRSIQSSEKISDICLCIQSIALTLNELVRRKVHGLDSPVLKIK